MTAPVLWYVPRSQVPRWELRGWIAHPKRPSKHSGNEADMVVIEWGREGMPIFPPQEQKDE